MKELSTPRLRMLAGPNGSGKSTIRAHIPPGAVGHDLNPDQFESELKNNGYLDVERFGLKLDLRRIQQTLSDATILLDQQVSDIVDSLSFSHNRLSISPEFVNSYVASALASMVRDLLIGAAESFTLETVMSHRSKIELLKHAQTVGYRTYLYYVATDDPAINISRVENRVQSGGHAVPVEKIEERYYRSLSLLREAVSYTNRAYIFDNSRQDSPALWLAEVTDGRYLELKSDSLPKWFIDHLVS